VVGSDATKVWHRVLHNLCHRLNGYVSRSLLEFASLKARLKIDQILFRKGPSTRWRNKLPPLVVMLAARESS